MLRSTWLRSAWLLGLVLLAGCPPGCPGCAGGGEVTAESCAAQGLGYEEANGQGYCVKEVRPTANADGGLTIGCEGQSDGAACNDGNACTRDDVCTGGNCTGTAVEVPADTSCIDYECTPAVGITITYRVTAACNDNDACTTGDQCNDVGECRGTALDFVAVVADNNPCTRDYCDPVTGVQHEFTPGSCSDGDACTVNDVCDQASGTCVGSPLPGLDDNNPCTVDRCNANDGSITHDPAGANGNPCDDGDVCSNNDVCTNSLCTGTYGQDANGNPVDDGDACTRDTCNAQGVRENRPYDLDNATDRNALVSLGFATAEDVVNPCLAYSCATEPEFNPLADGTSCADPAAGRSDGPCVKWACQAGACAAVVDQVALATAPAAPSTLHAGCRMRICDTSTGEVAYAPDSSRVGAGCDDGNACTYADACTATGSCVGNAEAAHNHACSDGSACTTGDTCINGTCTPARDLLTLATTVADPLNPSPDDAYRDPAGLLAAADPCKTYACDPTRGVVVGNTADGTTCDDGNPCSSADQCQAGVCVGTSDPATDGAVCDHPTNPCQVGACEKGACVAFEDRQDGTTCTPGVPDPCNVYTCQAGACSDTGNAVNGVNCDVDPTDCVEQACNGAGACVADPAGRNGEACTSPNYDARCTAPTCNNGACDANPVIDGTACALTEADVQTAADLVCNTGACTAGYCLPVSKATNPVITCNNGNACDGADWCVNVGGVGRCVERYPGDLPTGAQGSVAATQAVCTNGLPPGDGQPPDPNCYDNLGPTAASGTTCEVDGNTATVGRCHYDGTCREMTRLVDDENDCTAPRWDETTGAVVHDPVADGTACQARPLNPCSNNHGICRAGACQVTPLPDGTLCNLAGQDLPNPLPDGHDALCYAEVCVAGQCVINTSRQDGRTCDDGGGTCSAPGACSAGACQANNTPRNFGETCTPAGATGIVDFDGRPIAEKDVGCWVAFECNSAGACVVAAARAANGTRCDLDLNGDTCDGSCDDGVCTVSNQAANTPNPTCDDGEPCTLDVCNGNGGCGAQALADGPRPGCQGPDPNNACLDLECDNGVCTGIEDDTNFCDDGNPCTVNDCTNGACTVASNVPNDTPCDDDGDEDCDRDTCQNGTCQTNADVEPLGSPCSDGNTCTVGETCDATGLCTATAGLTDGTNCDTNGVPCDEGCFDYDSAVGPQLARCVPFTEFEALLTPSAMAANGNPNDALGAEELACRDLLDPTYDPNAPDATCTRYACYLGACRLWNETLATAAGIGPNPLNNTQCGEAGPCNTTGVCQDNTCVGYHAQPDGTLCSLARCEGDGAVTAHVCVAGTCVETEAELTRCDLGLGTCRADTCAGDLCEQACTPGYYDYVNAFEDISPFPDGSWLTELRSPLDPADVRCADLPGTGAAATEQERMACDDGAVLLSLAQLGFAELGNGAWLFNRRYTHLNLSANGAVAMHKRDPAEFAFDQETVPGNTLFTFANVGGASDAAGKSNVAGTAINDATGTAQLRPFLDDLTFVTDPDEERPNDTTEYGAFVRFGGIYTKRMAGPTYAAEDDYLIIQWNDAAFFGCAPSDASRAHMTFQVKWWPYTGLIVFAYPDSGNDDGPVGSAAWCIPDRVRGEDAVIGLASEGNVPDVLVGQDGLLLTTDSGPGTEPLEDFFVFWPQDWPPTGYQVRAWEPFHDLSAFDVALGRTRGNPLPLVSNCNECCQAVPLSPPIYWEGFPREVMYVCADGYVHFQDPRFATFEQRSFNGDQGQTLTTLPPDQLSPGYLVAPWWGDLRMEASPASNVSWLDETVDGLRRVTVQWTRVDHPYRVGQLGLLPAEQEQGEFLCTDDGDQDGDGATDCADTSCACAVACGGQGCGLTFQAILHVGLGAVEFRYLDTSGRYAYAADSTVDTAPTDGVVIGAQQFQGYGLDLSDGVTGGGLIPPFNYPLTPGDVDEQLPSQQRNVILIQNAWLPQQ
ncbi:MAG: hypothetical protein AB2A00_23955 [Myxococcota bacterium]